MSTLELELYDAIKDKLGDKESKMLLELMETKVEKEVSKSTRDIATKADLAAMAAIIESKLVKWMFLFWAGTVALSGILKAVGVL